MGESQSRSVMLHHQDQPVNAAYGGQGGANLKSSSSLQNRKCNKDSNFNFLPGRDDESVASNRGGDENRNQARPRSLGPLGRDTHTTGLLSPRSRLPCWSPLEPLPEIESGDDGYGRVPPDGAEERGLEGEEGRTMMMMMMSHNDEKQREKRELRRRSGSEGFGEREDDEDEEDDGDEWGDSDSESEFSRHSGGSVSSLNMESGGEGTLAGGWDRVGVGEPRWNQQESSRNGNGEAAGRHRSFGTGAALGNVREEQDGGEDGSSDSDGEVPELMDAVWTLRDRERFKAQEMEKHQVQLTMYRRLALIRWVRTLQGRVQEQQNRLQSSFDVILTHRKELLRMGAAAATATAPTAAVGQS